MLDRVFEGVGWVFGPSRQDSSANLDHHMGRLCVGDRPGWHCSDGTCSRRAVNAESYEAIEACVRSHNSWLHMPGEQWVRVSLDHILRILLPVVALAVLTLVQPETTSAISQLTLRGVTGSHVPVYRVMDYISQNTGFPYMDSPA